MAKKRIAILGGGMASLVTAFELTSRPGWRDDSEITVYQTGFRLGGKGASGRNPDLHQRIEEHGLHIMFGFYDNVFRVMKEAYSEMGRAPAQPLATWQEAFKPHDLIVMMEKVGDELVPWAVSPPRNHLEPGTESALVGPLDYLGKLLEHARDRFHAWAATSSNAGAAAAARLLGRDVDLGPLRSLLGGLARAGEAVIDETASAVTAVAAVSKLIGHALSPVVSDAERVWRSLENELPFLDLAHELTRRVVDPMLPAYGPAEHGSIGWLLRKFLAWLWEGVEELSTEFRRLRIELDFALTIALGMLEDGLVLPPVDWFKIDHWDFRDWLRHHGAQKQTVASPLVDGLYDAIFSTDAPMAAGTIIHLLLCMGFNYKTAVNFKMQAGMGDTVFTPLYLVLKRRGVRFEFFHCVNEIRLSAGPGPRRVERIEMGVQATLAPGVSEYDPLVEVKDLLSWPSVPRYEQLAQGAELAARKVDLEDWWTAWKDVGQKTLQAGKDFDVCVLGISVAAFPYICKDMMEDAANPRWKTMVEGIATCQTAAAQLWFGPGLAQTGWPTSLPEPIVIPYVEPLDTWCDMTQLVCRETWPEPLPVGSCHYLCSNLEDEEPLPPRDQHDYAKRQNQRVHDVTVKWLSENMQGLWPKATMPADPAQLNWWWLVDESNAEGVARFESQYWHAPVSPSERYNLSVPDSSRKRLRADESGYANLVLAGDWTLTALSAGCLEAATMSGIASANAVDGVARTIMNDWLPQAKNAIASPAPEPPAAPSSPRDRMTLLRPHRSSSPPPT
jgi:uncharacterized protein with NAD-binding domain and iron-sulfur cluster